MKAQLSETDMRVKQKNMGRRGFAISYATMLFLVGIQTGILILPAFNHLNAVMQIVVIMGYWAMVAMVFSLITNWQIRQAYDKPMRKLSSAAKKVAEGDFSVYVEPLHTADKYDYIDVMFMDFNLMVQELGSIETLKNDFVANVSHEIKTPLAVIKSYTSALKNTNLSPAQQQEYMDAIIKATDNLSMLVSNILRLNKLDNQEIGLPGKEYDLCRQLCECALRYEPLWEKKHIEFTAEIEDKAIITADESMLEIVWNNLLGNALKFTGEGGKVSLSQTSDANSITVVVTDTGCGMDKETVRRVFDKFYQADTSHGCEGNGLGLTLAYRVIEKLGGSITVISQPQQGSIFTVSIPLE